MGPPTNQSLLPTRHAAQHKRADRKTKMKRFLVALLGCACIALAAADHRPSHDLCTALNSLTQNGQQACTCADVGTTGLKATMRCDTKINVNAFGYSVDEDVEFDLTVDACEGTVEATIPRFSFDETLSYKDAHNREWEVPGWTFAGTGLYIKTTVVKTDHQFEVGVQVLLKASIVGTLWGPVDLLPVQTVDLEDDCAADDDDDVDAGVVVGAVLGGAVLVGILGLLLHRKRQPHVVPVVKGQAVRSLLHHRHHFLRHHRSLHHRHRQHSVQHQSVHHLHRPHVVLPPPPSRCNPPLQSGQPCKNGGLHASLPHARTAPRFPHFHHSHADSSSHTSTPTSLAPPPRAHVH